MSTTEHLRRRTFASWLRRVALLFAGGYAFSVLVGVMAVLGPQGSFESTLPPHSVAYPLTTLLGPFTGYVGTAFGFDALRFPIGAGLGLTLCGVVLLALARFAAHMRWAAWLLGLLAAGWCVVWFGASWVVLLSLAEI